MPDLIAPNNYSRFYQGSFADEKMIGVSSGFLSFFGNLINGGETNFLFDTQAFDIDIERSGRTIAATVLRGITGTFTDTEVETGDQFSAFSRVFPLVREAVSLNAEQAMNRLLGERPYSGMTKADRLRKLARKKHLAIIKKHMGTHELMASRSILDGKMPAILGTTNANLIYDWRRSVDNTITGSDWSEGGNEIMFDIDKAADKVHENGKVLADMIIIGRNAMVDFLAQPEIKTFFETRRLDQGSIDINSASRLPEKFKRFTGPGGLEPRGVLMTPKGRELWVFNYNQLYENPKGINIYFMDQDKAIVAWSQARHDRYFGPGQALDPTTGQIQWYLDRFGFTPDDIPMPENKPVDGIFDSRMFHTYAFERDQQVIRVVTESAPIYATTMTDSIAVLTGLAAA